MKERYDDPKFYYHVFYPKGTWKMVAPIILGPLFGFGIIFLGEFLNPEKKMPLKVKLILLGIITVVLLIPLLVLRLWQLKRVQLGIGKGGVYVRGTPKLLSWSEIKKIELIWHPKHKKSIKIKTYSPIEKGKEVSWFEKIMRSAANAFGEELDTILIHGRDFISIPFEELIKLLQTYHEKYKEERQAKADFWGATKEKPLPEKKAVLKVPFWAKLGGAALLVLGLFVVALIEGESGTKLWISLGAAIFASAVVFFATIRTIFILAASFGMIFFGAGFFIYTLVWKGDPLWASLVVVAGGFYFLIIFWWATRKEKKLK